MTNIKSFINFKLIGEYKYDQQQKYSVFEGLQNGGKKKSVDFIVYHLEIWWCHNFKTSRVIKKRNLYLFTETIAVRHPQDFIEKYFQH